MRPDINAGGKGKVWKLYSEKLRANEHFSQPWDSAKGRSIHQPTADEGPMSPKKHRAEQTLQCHDLGVWNVTAQKRSWLVFKQPSQYSLACPLHTWQFCKPLPLSWAMNPTEAQPKQDTWHCPANAILKFSSCPRTAPPKLTGVELPATILSTSSVRGKHKQHHYKISSFPRKLWRPVSWRV